MRVKTWVETSQEVEVEVSIAEVMSSISALAEDDQPHMLLDCISAVWRVLQGVPDARIAAMTDRQREIIGNALRTEAARFMPPNDADSRGPKGPSAGVHSCTTGERDGS
jgi:predicted ATPase